MQPFEEYVRVQWLIMKSLFLVKEKYKLNHGK